jgi:hypothetical protein
MAVLEKKGMAGFNWTEGEDPDVYLKRTGKLVEQLQNKSDSLPDGEVVGALVSFPVADGSAIYVVTKAKPLTVKHVPYGGAAPALTALLGGHVDCIAGGPAVGLPAPPPALTVAAGQVARAAARRAPTPPRRHDPAISRMAREEPLTSTE